MRKILLVLLALTGLVVSTFADAAWNADWKQRAKVSLNTAADGVPLGGPTDAVPVLVRLHTGNFAFTDAKPDGTDLRFIAADDKTPLKFHIEKFDGLNELALIWVQVPRINAGAKNDFFWLYYGNPAAAAGDDAKGTYDAAQVLVYHFAQSDGVPQDTTANGNHGAGSTAKPNGTGVIGGGLTFDGATELAVPTTPSLKAGAGGMTLSFWFKPSELVDDVLYTQGNGATGLRLSLRGGKLVAQAGSLTATSTASISAGVWQHLAVVVKDGVTLFINGSASPPAAGANVVVDGPVRMGKGWKGEIDELELSNTARSADWIKLAAQGQGPDQKLVSYGPADGESADKGPSYLKILLGSVTVDGWVVIGILMVMFVISVYVMVSKAFFVAAAARDNERFKLQFEKMLGEVATGVQGDAPDSAEKAAAKRFRSSSLYRLYASGVHELRNRFDAYAKAGRAPVLTDQSINAIRATIDARLVREQQRINSRMVLLTICIAGGPFLGLLGTVVGVMITFAAIAAAGDVNVNAIAPGIAAALVATVAGLAVAIPALFAYNYLTSRISELTSDMQVFIDEFVTRIAENYSV